MVFGQEVPSQHLISMNFHNVNVDSVLHFFGEATGLTIVKDPGLTEEISIRTFGETSVEEGVRILNSVLSVKGYTIIKTGNLLKIVPLTSISTTNVEVIKDYNLQKNTHKDDRVVTKMISLQYARSEEVVEALKPLVGSFGTAIAYDRTNTIIITDTSANIDRLTQVIDDLDRQVTALVTKSYRIEHAKLEVLVDLLRQITKQYAHELGHFEINLDTRTRHLFVTTIPENFGRVEKLIKQLDHGVPQILLETEVVRLPYRNIDIDIRHRLFEHTSRRYAEKTINKEDQLFSWRYGLDADPEKMFSWYGYSSSKIKENYVHTLNALFGPDYFEIYSLPMITVSEGSEAMISMGHEDYFFRLAPLKVTFRIVPHLNEDETITLEMYQSVRGDWIKLEEAYSRIVVNNDQTIVLGGLNELREAVGPTAEKTFREDTQFVSNEFLVFITPHVILDPQSFKKKVEKQAKEAKLKGKKPDLGLLFPGGFMENEGAISSPDFAKIPEEHSKIIAKELRGPPSRENAYRIWWKMQDLVNLPDELVEVKDQMSDRNFVDREIKKRLRKDAAQFMNTIRTEQDLEMEPAITLNTHVQKEALQKDGYVLKETMYRRGISFYKKGHYKGAIREFAPVMSVDPSYKSVQRYMQLSQQKYKQQLEEKVEERAITEKIKEKALKDLTMVKKTMDQKKMDMDQKEAMNDYIKSEHLFEYEGDPKNIPSDRMQQENVNRISGEILEVSLHHPLVVINLGTIHKVQTGMAFKVYREHEFVGKVRVSDIGEHVSGAEIISIKTPDFALKFGDKVLQA
jgi:type II secretory pathway component GspD/PulD (secretin)